jgi:hypothetical protein
MDVFCNKGILVSKEYNLRRQCETVHEKKFGHLKEKIRADKLNILKSDPRGQQKIFTVLINQVK